MVLVWLSVLLELQTGGDGLFSEIGVVLTFIVQAAANGELGLSVPMSPLLGRRRRAFFSFLFFVGLLCIKLRLKAIVCWGRGGRDR